MPFRAWISPLCLCAFLVACGSPEERAAAYLADAQAFFDEGNYEAALLEAQNATQIEPKNAQARMLLAELAEQRNDFRQAIGHLLVAVDSDPTLVDAHVKLGSYYTFVGATTPATEQAELAMELAPDLAETRLLNARVQFLNGNVEGAFEEVDVALEIEPDYIDAIGFKAALHEKLNNRAAAFDILDEAIPTLDMETSLPLREFRAQLLRSEGRLDDLETELLSMVPLLPESDKIEQQLVELYVAQGRVEDAESMMLQLIADDPDNQRTTRQSMVGFLADQRSPERAEEALLAFIAEAPQSADLRLLLGRFYEQVGRVDEAVVTYREVVALGGVTEAGLTARSRIVATNVKAGQLDEARAELEKILEDAPDDPEALLFRAGFHYEDGAYDEALADLRVVLRRSGEDERAWLLLARTYRISGETVLAEDAYRHLLDANPRYSRVAIELAKMVGRQGQIDAAIAILREAMAASPQNEDLAANMVDILIATGDINRAETEARRMTTLGIETGQPEYQLARVLKAKGDNDGAIAAYEAALEKEPTAVMALQGFAQMLVESERGAEALTYIEELSPQHPERYDIKFLLGALYANQGEPEKAEAMFEEVIAAKPDADRVYETLAVLNADDAVRLEEIFKQGVEGSPDSERLSMLLGNQYAAAGRYEEALEVYEEFLTRNEDSSIAVNNVAAMLLDHREDIGSHARALELVTRFRNVRHPVLLDTLGWAYYRNGRYLDAVRYLEMAVAGAGQVAEMRYHLGMAYNATKNPVGAKQELRTAIELAERSDGQIFQGLDDARQTLDDLTAGSG